MSFHIHILDELPLKVDLSHPLYFVSDLHLGDGGPADDFTEDRHQAAFEWFLEHEVEPDGGRLVLLGDVFELWQCDLADIRDHYGGFFWRLHNYRLIRGNHDSPLRMPPEWRLVEEEAGRPALRILAEHGHRADLWNSKLGFVGRTVTILAGILERLGLKHVDDWKWRHLPTPRTHPQRLPDSHYVAYARKRAQETGARIVVLGHTHRPTLVRLEDITYANTGCWTRSDLAGSFVRVHCGLVELCHVLPA